MRNPYLFVLIMAGVFWAIFLFFGYISTLGKAFKTKQPLSTNSVDLRDKQTLIADQAEQQRKDLMEKYKQRIKDYEAQRKSF